MYRELKVLILFFSVILFGSCRDCEEVKPDLVSDLIVESIEVALGEPMDIEYVVESVEESFDCKIASAAASIASVIIDLFDDEMDEESELFGASDIDVSSLESGEMETFVSRYGDVQKEGIYMIEVMADSEEQIDERDEMNNLGESAIDNRAEFNDDFSMNFLNKLKRTQLIVVVGESPTFLNNITKFRGIDVLYVR